MPIILDIIMVLKEKEVITNVIVVLIILYILYIYQKKTPGNQDYHGCPIKVFNNELFKKYLQYNDINNIDEIMELKSNNHF